MTLDTWDPDLQRPFARVPMPPTARAAAGSDQSMTVWQPSRTRLWDFWHMRRERGGWHAHWGGEMKDVSANPGHFTLSGETDDCGATGERSPLLRGLVTFEDLRRGYVNHHRLAIGLVETHRAKYTCPAQRTDGSSFTPGTTAIPEECGSGLTRIWTSVAFTLPPIDRMLAGAAQKYGIVVHDKTGSVVFYVQDPVTQSSTPCLAAFRDQSSNKLLALSLATSASAAAAADPVRVRQPHRYAYW